MKSLSSKHCKSGSGKKEPKFVPTKIVVQSILAQTDVPASFKEALLRNRQTSSSELLRTRRMMKEKGKDTSLVRACVDEKTIKSLRDFKISRNEEFLGELQTQGFFTPNIHLSLGGADKTDVSRLQDQLDQVASTIPELRNVFGKASSLMDNAETAIQNVVWLSPVMVFTLFTGIMAIRKGTKIWFITFGSLTGILTILMNPSIRDAVMPFLQSLITKVHGLNPAGDTEDESEVDMDSIPVQSLDDSIVEPIAGALVSLCGCLTMGSAPKGSRVKTFIREISIFHHAKNGMVSLVSWLISICEKAVNFIRDHCLGLPSLRLVKTSEKEVLDWTEKVLSVSERAHRCELPVNAHNGDHLFSLIKKGDDLLLNRRAATYSLLTKDILMTHQARLRKLYSPFENSNVRGMGPRLEPYCFILFGKPGVGKSYMLVPFVNDVLAKVLTGEEFERFKKHYNEFIYSRQPEHDYWDNYSDHYVTLFDDFGQIRDSVNRPDGEYMNLIRCVNIMPNILHMADIADKGSVAFQSKLVGISTNLNMERIVKSCMSIVEPDALLRRFDYQVHVHIKPEFRKSSSSALDKDHPAVRDRKFNSDVYEFEIKDGDAPRFLTYDQLVAEVVVNLKQRLSTGQSYLDSLQERLNFSTQSKKVVEDLDDVREVDWDSEEKELFEFKNVSPMNLDPTELAKRSGTMSGDSILNELDSVWKPEATSSYHVHGIAHWLRLRSHSFNLSLQDYWAIHADFEKVLTDLEKYEDSLEIFKVLNQNGCHSFAQKIRALVTSDMWVFLSRFSHSAERRPVIKKILTARELPARMLHNLESVKTKGDHSSLVAEQKTLKEYYSFYREKFSESVSSPRILEYKNMLALLSLAIPVIGGFFYYRKSGQKKITADPKAEIKIFGETQVSTDVNCGEVTSRLVRSHIYRFQLPNTSACMGTVMMIGDRVMLINTHFLHRIDQLIDEGICYAEDHVTIYNPFSNRNYMVKMCDLIAAPKVVLDNRDATLVKMPNCIAVHKNITGFFIPSDVVSTMSDMYGRLVVLKDKEICCFGASILPRKSFNISGSGYSSVIDSGYEYRIDTASGDCGAPLLIVNKSLSPYKIAGMHVAGAAGMGCSVALSQESIKSAYAKLSSTELPKIIPLEHEETMTVQAADVDFFKSPDSSFTYVESLRKRHTVPGNSVLRPSRMKDEFADLGYPKKAPALLYDRGDISPYENALVKYGRPNVGEFENLDMCVNSVLSHLWNSSSHPLVMRVYTFEEAILGNPLRAYHDSIPRNTSPGYPFVDLQPPGSKGKSYWFGSGDCYDLSCPGALTLRRRVSDLLDDARRGIRRNHIYMDVLKDELRSHEKVRTGMTRMIMCCPLDLTVAFRMYFLDFCIWIMENRINNSIAIGINVYSSDWNRLSKNLVSKGDACFDGDYAGFDTCHDPVLIWALLNLINEWYSLGVTMKSGSIKTNNENKDKLKIDNRVRRVLWAEIANSKHLIDFIVYMWDGKLPSGVPLTAILTSLINLTILTMSWTLIKGPSMLPSFWTDVYCIVFGDDNVVNVSDTHKADFNLKTISVVMKKMGYEYTPADKTDQYLDYKTLSKCTFLKRTFRWDPARWANIAPLAIDSILEPLCWTKKGYLRQTIEIERVNIALRELSLHERDVFALLAPRVISASRSCLGHSPIFTDYFGLQEAVLNETNGTASFGGRVIFPAYIKSKDLKSKDCCDPTVELLSYTTQGDFKIPGTLSATSLLKPARGERIRLAANINDKGTPSSNGESSVEETANIHADMNVTTVGKLKPINFDPRLFTNFSDGAEHDLKGFFARPVQILRASWTTSMVPGANVLFCNLYNDVLQNTLMKAKINGFLAFRGTAVVRVQLNATRYLQGRLITVFFPQYSEHTNRFFESMVCIGSQTQLPRVDLDASTDTEVIMRIPYVNSRLAFNTADQSGDIGVVAVNVYSPLVSTTSELYAELTMWVHFEDVCLEYPVAPSPTYTVQAGEYNTVSRKTKVGVSDQEATRKKEGPVSSFLGKSLGVINFAKNIPLLSTVAGPAWWAVALAQNAASAFGFSNPPNTTKPLIVAQKPFHNAQNVSGHDDSYNLGLFEDNHIEALPSFAGQDVDEMTFDHILSIPAFWRNFSWSNTQDTGTLLFSSTLYPTQFYTNSRTVNISIQTGVPVQNPLPVAYVSNLFRLYRGSMVFKFKVVKTEFHSGRIMATFSPGQTVANSTRFEATTYVHKEIYDIRYTNEFQFSCPWASTTEYRQVADSYGTLCVWVLNELRQPDTVAGSVDVLIEAYCAPDFEFAVPRAWCTYVGNADTSWYPFHDVETFVANPSQVKLVGVTPMIALPAPAPSVESEPVIVDAPSIAEFKTQAGDETSFQTRTSDQSEEPAGAIGSSRIGFDEHLSSRCCIGEKIVSLRQLLKKHTVSAFTLGTTGDALNYQPWFLEWVSKYGAGVPGASFVPNYLTYITALYGYARGSLRVRTYVRDGPFTNMRNALYYSNVTLKSQDFPATNNNWRQNGVGPVVTFAATNPYSEVQVPFYSTTHSVPLTCTWNEPGRDMTGVPSVVIQTRAGSTSAAFNMYLTRQVGDDFSLGFFLGCPSVIQLIFTTNNGLAELW